MTKFVTMKKNFRLFFLCLFLINSKFWSQKDSLNFGFHYVAINFGGHLPKGDLEKRFGPNLNIGGTYMYKTKSNWQFGAEGNYFFGQNVKEDVLANMKVDFSNGQKNIIDNEGYPADIRITERGLCFYIVGGRIFKLFKSNLNTGIVFNVGVGYMQHKINLYDAQKKIAALNGELRYGYDRLSNGLSTIQFLGYQYISNNRFINFYAGFEFIQGYTKSVRKFNYDTGLPDTNKRTDLLIGARIGWILPLYKRKPKDYYYY